MDPEAVAAAGEELVAAIEDQLGEGWTEIEGLDVPKEFVIWDDGTVALASRNWAFYLIEDELWSRHRHGESIATGRFHEGKLRVTAVTDAPDASRN